MGELNEKYAGTIKQLDEWIKSYIQKICINFDPDVMKLYVEEDSTSKLQWRFSVKESSKRKSLTTLMKIFSEILEEKIPSFVALDEIANILSYAEGKNRDFYEGLKRNLFEKIADGKLIRDYVHEVMKEIPEKEIFIQLSAMNYEKRVTHTHLVFGMDFFTEKSENDSIIFDKAMKFEIEKIRLIRKLMEISRETYGLVVEKKSDSDWYIKGAIQLSKLKDAYQVEIAGHSVWKLKYGEEELFEYKEGIYTLPPIGTAKDAYDEEYRNLEKVISDEGKRENIKTIISKIRKIASHGTGMIFIEEVEPKSNEESFLKKEIDRLAKVGKAYAIMEHSLKLSGDTSDEVLKGITAVDGAVFCNFNAECKAFGVIVDGETVKKGDPGRGAKYNSLTNYVKWLNSDKRNANVKCIAVVMSEDGPLNIEVSVPGQLTDHDKSHEA